MGSIWKRKQKAENGRCARCGKPQADIRHRKAKYCQRCAGIVRKDDPSGADAMKILVATKQTQGQNTLDRCGCDEGEVVFFHPDEPDSDEMVGTRTLGFTTTFKVTDAGVMDAMDLADTIAQALERRGKGLHSSMMDRAMKMALEIIKRADQYDDGDVLELRGGIIFPRKT